MTKTLVCSLLSLALMPALVSAASDTDRVKVLVKQKMSIDADSVTRLPSGLYEVVADRNLLYVDKDVKFFFSGYIFDIATQKNLTQERLDELSRIDIASLPLDQALKTVHGKGEHNIYVFADPYCGFCGRLEETLKTVDNVTIYTFVTPLLNSSAMVDRIYCSSNPEQAWNDWMLSKKEPPQLPTNCKNTNGEKNLALFNRLGMQGAPCMYFDDGYRLEGAVSKEEILVRLREVENSKK